MEHQTNKEDAKWSMLSGLEQRAAKGKETSIEKVMTVQVKDNDFGDQCFSSICCLSMGIYVHIFLDLF